MLQFTIESIGFACLTILGTVVSIYLLNLKNKTNQTWWFTLGFISRTFFYTCLLLTFSVQASWHYVFIPSFYIFVIVSHIFTIQFYYLLQDDIFPKERKIVLYASIGITAFLSILMLYDVFFTPHPHFTPILWISLLIVFNSLFMLVLLIRKYLFSIDYQLSALFSQFIKPKNENTKAYVAFIWVTVILIAVTFVNIFRDTGLLPFTIFNILFLTLSLLLLYGFVYAFINHSGQETSISIKLVTLSLATVMAILGTSVYLVYSQDQIARDINNIIPANETIIFDRQSDTDFRVRQTAYFYSPLLGERVEVEEGGALEIDLGFEFPFFDHSWTTGWLHYAGTISFGERVHTPNTRAVQYYDVFFRDILDSTPKIIANMIPYDNIRTGVIYVNRGENEITITWFIDPTTRVATPETVQLYLNSRGQIQFRNPVESPPLISALRGIHSGTDQTNVSHIQLSTISASGRLVGTVVDNFKKRYTNYSHIRLTNFMYQLAFASIVIVFGFPVLFKNSIINPLENLQKGVEEIDAGNYDIQLEISLNDEIGSLTRGFNRLGISLKEAQQQLVDYAQNLEQMVTDRTIELEKLLNQSKIEMAADRVRAEISGMRNVSDVEMVMPLVWKELTNLDIPFFRCGLFIFDEDNETALMRLTNPNGKPLVTANLAYDDLGLIRPAVKFWKNNEIYKDFWTEEDLLKWTSSMIEKGVISDLEHYLDAKKPPEQTHLQFIPFMQGMIYIGSRNPLEKDHLETIQRLAKAFSVAYSRYEDFLKLDEKNQAISKALEDLQNTQEQLVQQEKLASLGQLTAGIAHEIKNPLNFVNNFSELSIELIEEIREELAGESITDSSTISEILDDIEANLKKIYEHGSRADNIVKSMLQHSRGGTGEKELTDINQLVKEFVNLSFHGMRAGSKVITATLDYDFDEKVGHIPVITEDFSRVILNICNNAFDAMYEVAENPSKYGKGEEPYKPKLRIFTRTSGNSVIIGIEDNGPGIPKGVRDRILQPFFTTKKGTEGTGLGLSITNDIVKAHGGNLGIESEEGRGTLFMIKLERT